MQICKLHLNSLCLVSKEINILKLIHILFLGGLMALNPVNANPGKQSHLAIGFFVGANSTVLTYAFVSTRDGKIVGSQVVRKERFMYVALGHWPGYVNPNRENLFNKHNIDSCFLIKDEYDKVIDYYCPPFTQLWKVRFKEHPVQYDLRGWSHGKYKPSQKQLEFLEQEYGIHNILTEYIYGDSLFKLLRDVKNQDWIANYMSLAKDASVTSP